MFFKFIRICKEAEKTKATFSLLWFSILEHQDDAKYWKALLRIQQQAVFEWFDRFRTGIDVDAVQKCLPDDLRTGDYRDETKW